MAAQVDKDTACRVYLVATKGKAGKTDLSLSGAGGFDFGDWFYCRCLGFLRLLHRQFGFLLLCHRSVLLGLLGEALDPLLFRRFGCLGFRHIAAHGRDAFSSIQVFRRSLCIRSRFSVDQRSKVSNARHADRHLKRFVSAVYLVKPHTDI